MGGVRKFEVWLSEHAQWKAHRVVDWADKSLCPHGLQVTDIGPTKSGIEDVALALQWLVD